MQHENEKDTLDNSENQSRYLIFSLGKELYGTPLHLVREVLKLGEVKEVPYMKAYFKGVINVRGKIISVLDLREKFGLKLGNQETPMMLVVEQESHLLSSIVDEVTAVATIDPSQIDTKPALSTKIPIEFFLGIGKWNNRLVNLIDIAGSLTKEDFSTVQRTMEAA